MLVFHSVFCSPPFPPPKHPGHVGACKFLLDKDGSLANSTTLHAGNTPFMWACWSGSLDVAKLLVSEGNVDPFVCNEDGFTAAHWAASGGHGVPICNFLKELRMSFVGKDAENKKRETPLDCAKSYGCSDVVDWVAKQN